MDNSNSLSNSLFKSSDNSFQPASTSIGTEGSSFVETLKNVNFTTWVIIFFVLAFLGFNIFVYLAEGTQEITNFFGPILKKVFGTKSKIVWNPGHIQLHAGYKAIGKYLKKTDIL
jgi:hypothetical protein